MDKQDIVDEINNDISALTYHLLWMRLHGIHHALMQCDLDKRVDYEAELQWAERERADHDVAYFVTLNK